MQNGVQILGSGGAMVILGAPPNGAVLELDPIFILGKERRIMGSKYGSSNPHIEFPMLVELYLAGKLDLDSLVTGHYRVDQSNEAFEVLARGGAGRGLITFEQ